MRYRLLLILSSLDWRLVGWAHNAADCYRCCWSRPQIFLILFEIINDWGAADHLFLIWQILYWDIWAEAFLNEYIGQRTQLLVMKDKHETTAETTEYIRHKHQHQRHRPIRWYTNGRSSCAWDALVKSKDNLAQAEPKMMNHEHFLLLIFQWVLPVYFLPACTSYSSIQQYFFVLELLDNSLQWGR